MTQEAFSGLEMDPVSGLTDAIPNRLAKQTAHYDIEYGIRADDSAMVFHFYPPGTDWSKYPPEKLGKWEESFQMHERLERAIPKVFDLQFVKAAFTTETQSFCIIVKGLGSSIDPWYFVGRFLAEVDAPL